MEFKKFKNQVQEQFKNMVNNVTQLHEVNIDKDALWNLYLDSFPVGTNEIFRERREHDCSCCKQFIRNIGNVVAIKDNVVTSIWDIDTDCKIYKPVTKALSEFVKSHVVSDIYINKERKIGTDKNFEDTGTKVYEWNHLYIELPERFVDKTGCSIGDLKGRQRDIRNVFKRSLDEITEESVITLLDLIAQNSLYKGGEWKSVLTEFLRYKREYKSLNNDTERELFAWEQAVKVGISVGKIKNHSIGTLLINLSEGMDLDTAVRKYEVIVAPSNYKRPKAIYTQKMLDDAKKTITELGYMDSLARRHATLNDITVNNILFVNRDTVNKVAGAMDIFDEMSKGVATNPKKFNGIEEVVAENFVNNILPTAQEIEVLLENKHANNLVSLVAPLNKDAKSMFKWNNNFGWAYSGNITDSDLKANVKNAGGKVDGVLRFSIQWNDGKHDACDLDAHCIEPGGNEIYYGDKRNIRTSGMLDVDIISPKKDVAAVENITWTDLNRMEEGTYKFYLKTFSGSCRHGFKAEIEFNGEIHNFEYANPTRSGEKIFIAEVAYSRVNGFSIKTLLPSTAYNKEVWGLTTNQFVPVSVIMNSPNYWDEQEGIGHKHVFFMLKDCKNEEHVNGFYNEFLKNELGEHKRVFEALGTKMTVPYSNDQLSGLGFSTTKRSEVIVKVKGSFERIVKVKF